MRRRIKKTWLGWVALLVQGACGGGGAQRSQVDETADLARALGAPSGPWLDGTEPVGPEVGGTQWRWVEAHCTEGPLDLESEGFAQQLRVEAEPEGLLLVFDHAWQKPSLCLQTVVLRAIPGSEPEADWTMRTEAHVSLPPGCGVPPDEDRPGHVRRRGQALEVFVQRTHWCRGLEVRMVYAPDASSPLGDDQVVRHFVAHFSRRDALRVSRLFAMQGTLVEPFTPSPSGVTRHVGRPAVHAWFAQAFAPVPWVAMRLTSLQPGEQPGLWLAQWQYMDPRLEAPVPGKTQFVVGGGEILEARLELLEQPREKPASGAQAASTPAAGPVAAAIGSEG